MTMLLDRWDLNKERVRTMGLEAITQAHAAGISAFYMDPAMGQGVVEHRPNGELIYREYDEGGMLTRELKIS
jgi:hypothetical protein